MVDIRKIVITRELVLGEGSTLPERPVIRAVGLAVIAAADLRPLWQAGAALGERLMPELVRLLDHPAVSYSKGALVGVNGESEHGHACIHPMLGKPMRGAIGGGKAVVPSTVKVAAAGTALDMPLSHKDEPFSFAHFDTITVFIADAPRPDEIVVAMAIADGGRLRNRCGDGPVR
jgi:hypothetical protein